MDPERRRALGAWYTPPALIDHLLDEVLAGGPPPGRVLDPACGDGRFLAAVAQRLGPGVELVGVDIDPDALALARANLGPSAELHLADGLAAEIDGPIDLVVGNPPFLSQLARATSRGGTSRIGGGPYTDTAALFLQRAVELVRADGGRVGLVLPQSVLAARDAGPVRAEVLRHAALRSLWVAGAKLFPEAQVLTVIATFERGARTAAVRRSRGRTFERVADAPAVDLAGRPSWSHLMAEAFGVPVLPALVGPVLGTIATCTADFRDEYYGLVGHVRDDADGPPLVTSGLIEIGRHAWGERAVTFAKQRHAAPRVALGELEPWLRSWADQRLVPKVLLAMQTRVLEACADPEGALLPGVPVVSVVPHDTGEAWLVTAALCSPVASAWAAARALGAGRSAKAIKLSAKQVAELPLPTDRGVWQHATEALRAGRLDTFGELMMSAHELDDPAVLAWWTAERRPRP